MGEGIKAITGYQAQEITPTFWDEILISAEIRGEHSGMPLLEANRRMREGSIDYWLSDSQLRTKSGKVRWVMDMSTSLRNSSGHCYGCLGILFDITDRAKQAMPQGGTFSIRAENIHVTKKMNLPVKDGDYVKVSFTDEGTGIPRKFLQKIFDPFFTTKQKGSGLGLATSHSIIQKHDGHIMVESKMDEGTTFILFLPAVKGRFAEEEVRREETTSKGSGKILIMDDEMVIRETLSELLAHFGYEVTCVNEGSEAIEEYIKAQNEGKTYDAVILDLTVPGGMGGEEAIKKLIEINPQIKAIAASGYSNEPVIADYTKYGFNAAATKPFDIEELHETLSRLLNK